MLHGNLPRRKSHGRAGCTLCAGNTPRAGFTLIELLVVIFIIAILAGLVTVAGWQAIVAMQGHSIVVETNNLEGAVVAYTEKLPDRFPDTITQNAGGTPGGTLQQNVVRAHIALLFPRNREGNIFAADRGDGQPGAFYQVELDPSETLVYFLGGNPTVNPVTNRPIGLFDNAEYPLSGGAPGQPVGAQRKKFYEFDTRRLMDVDGDGFFSFVPRYPSNSPPYVYFDNRTYAFPGSPPTALSQYPMGVAVSPVGIARPYANDTSNQGGGVVAFEQPTKFQIIAAGLDRHFGDLPTGSPPPFKQYPSGLYYTRQDRDNVTSFAEGALESKLP